MKKIVISSLLVIGLIANTALATYAYFSNTEQRNATVTTAKIDLDTLGSFPLTFEKLVPDEDWKYQTFDVKNVGNVKADFYVEMDAGPVVAGEPNFCKPDRYALVNVEVYNGAWTSIYNGSICRLYPWEADSFILKIGDDVIPDGVKSYRIGLKLIGATPNEFQNLSKTDKINFIATQYNGPALVSCANGIAYPNGQWPQCDPNY
ncbi:MAG: hypothetical protein GYA48_06385 [Chloroflexi bacterium]|nr:hypothetical protein [Chloroflexota bacterium]